MNRSRIKSPEILTSGIYSPQSQSPRPFSPNDAAYPSPKAPLSKFSVTSKQPRTITSARVSSRNLSLIPTSTPQQPSKASKVNLKLALFDPALKKVSSQSTRSSYAAPFSDRGENTDSEQLPSPGKPVFTDNPFDNNSNILTKSIFNKMHNNERKVSFRDSDTEDITVSSVFSGTEGKPKVGKVRVSTRFAVLNKVVAQSQSAKTGILKNSPKGNDTLEADSVVSIPTSPETKDIRGINLALENPDSPITKPVQRKRESFSANANKRKSLGEEAPQKMEVSKRSSRIMTKELEMKFGVKLDNNNSTDSSSESGEEGQLNKDGSPKKRELNGDEKEGNGEGSPKKKRFSAVREFILRRHAAENLKVDAKREELEKQQCEQFVKNYPESARERPHTSQGHPYNNFENRRSSERRVPFNGKLEGEKVFVTGNTDFFQLNPGSRTYKEFKDIFNEDLKAFGTPEKKNNMEEDKEVNDEYKPMIVYFSAGSKILQPKYMTKMGSMCCTELWPKKLSMYMQKHLVQAKDCVKLADTGRNHEMVYRPKKWQNEDSCQKNISKNIQSRRNGHDALIKSAVPSSRKTRSVQTAKGGFEV